MSKITYTDKEYIYENAEIPAINKITDDDMNEIKSVVNENDTRLTTGWYKTGINPTFTFVSYDSATLTGVVSSDLDMTPYLNVGMKVKFTQSGTTKYGIITAITSTQITIFMGTDYSINNSAISNTYYSMLKAPFGFPLDPNKWSVIVSNANEYTQSNPSGNTWYNLGSNVINIPIGEWDINYELAMEQNRATANYITMYTTLSTTNNGNTDDNWKLILQVKPITNYTIPFYKIRKNLIFASKTSLYLNIMTDQTGTANIKIRGSLLTTVIKAECAYL